jgi:hypothetical protein
MRAPRPLLGLIVCASCTGAGLEKPTSPSKSVESAAVRDAVRRLTAKDAARPSPSAAGLQVFKVDQSSQVVVAKTNPDGTVTAKCVESADDAFLDEAPAGSDR